MQAAAELRLTTLVDPAIHTLSRAMTARAQQKNPAVAVTAANSVQVDPNSGRRIDDCPQLAERPEKRLLLRQRLRARA